MGGACEQSFSANTFEEMVELSKAHGMEMMQKQDPEHLAVMMQMKSAFETPGAMETYIADKKKAFDATPDD
jgi:hypothetical protein